MSLIKFTTNQLSMIQQKYILQNITHYIITPIRSNLTDIENKPKFLLILITNINLDQIQKYRQRQKMRSRSCAIHSQSQQQFILIAEKTMNKNGFFYDDKYYAQVEKIQSDYKMEKAQQKNTNIFKQFDFDQVKEFQRDQIKLNDEIQKHPQITIKNVVVCDNVLAAKQILSTEQCDKNQNRQVDLVLKKFIKKQGLCIIVKYWVINYSIIDTPLVQIYLESASGKYWLSENQCTMKDFSRSKVEQFGKFITKLEGSYMGIQQ